LSGQLLHLGDYLRDRRRSTRPSAYPFARSFGPRCSLRDQVSAQASGLGHRAREIGPFAARYGPDGGRNRSHFFL